MRRKKIEKVKPQRHSIRVIRPWFFWYKCDICGDELRREKMYEIVVRWTRKLWESNFGIVIRSDGISIDTYCFCMECCSTIQDAESEFEKRFSKMYEGV